MTRRRGRSGRPSGYPVEGRKKPILTSSGDPITWDQLLDAKWPDDVDPLSVALILADEFGNQTGTDRFIGKLPDINPFSVGAAIMVALAHAGGRTYDDSYSVQDSPEIRNLCLGLIRTTTRVQHPGVRGSGTTKFDAIWGTLLGTLGAQTSVQGDWWWDLGRSQILSGLAGFENLARDPEPASSLFREAVGSDPELGVPLLVALAHRVVKIPIVSVTRYAAQGPRSDELAAAMLELSRRVACPLEDVDERVRRTLRRHQTLDSRVYAFWMTHPLIKIGPDHVLLAPHVFARFVLGHGLHLMLRQVAGSCSDSPDNEFTRKFGDRFEEYLGIILAHRSDVVQCVAEHRFSVARTEWLSPDHVVVDRLNRNRVLLVEAKSSRLSLPTLLGAGLRPLGDEVVQKFSAHVAQVLRYVKRLHETERRGDLLSETLNSSELVLRAKEVIVLVAVPFLPPVFHFREVRAIVEAALPDQLSEDEWQWLVEFRKRTVVRWHICGASDIEAFACGRRRRGLVAATREYLRSIKGKPTLGRTGILYSLRDFLLKEGTDARLPAMLAVLDRIFTRAGAVFGDEDAPPAG